MNSTKKHIKNLFIFGHCEKNLHSNSFFQKTFLQPKKLFPPERNFLMVRTRFYGPTVGRPEVSHRSKKLIYKLDWDETLRKRLQ